MITQNFLTELELSLIRAYNRASKKGIPKQHLGADILLAAKEREQFVQEFMASFQSQSNVIAKEIEKGGHDSQKVLDKISREVEAKLRASLFQNKVDQASFQKIVRDLKNDVRSVFYERYLSK